MNEAKVRTIIKEEIDDFRIEFNQALAQFFGEMNRRFDQLEKKLDSKADKDVVYAQLDAILARFDHEQTERVALTHQVQRHERYLRELPGTS